ncbi:MAG: hypothetical protein V3T29_07270 [Alphaproteobacteria bacterium]
MSRPRRNLAGTLFLAATLAIVAAAPARADLDGARAAYDEGDYGAARAQLEPLAQGGDAEAQYLMGLSYYHGSGALRDDARAAAWFRKAAARDHGYAMYALGLMHDLGRGVTRSHGEAMLWYRRAAHKGVQQAIAELSRSGGGR